MTDILLYLINIIHINLPLEFVYQLEYKSKGRKTISNNNTNVNPTEIFKTMRD